MNLTLPRVRQMPTPNYLPTLIRHDLLIAHRTEGEQIRTFYGQPIHT